MSLLIAGALLGGRMVLSAYEKGKNTLVRQMAKQGFVVDDILVEGRHHTDKETLLAALNFAKGDAIFGSDLKAIKERLEQLPWVRSAILERRLPNTLYVRLSESSPFAIWQFKQKLHVIDTEGKVIAGENFQAYTSLPVLVGEKAPHHAVGLLNTLSRFPEIKRRLKAATWIGNRRWNLHLDTVEIKLPEGNYEEALKRFIKLEKEHQISERFIKVIDLRFGGKLILRREAERVKRF